MMCSARGHAGNPWQHSPSGSIPSQPSTASLDASDTQSSSVDCVGMSTPITTAGCFTYGRGFGQGQGSTRPDLPQARRSCGVAHSQREPVRTWRSRRRTLAVFSSRYAASVGHLSDGPAYLAYSFQPRNGVRQSVRPSDINASCAPRSRSNHRINSLRPRAESLAIALHSLEYLRIKFTDTF